VPQVSKGCLTAFLGIMALILDSLFIGAVFNFNPLQNKTACRAAGCTTGPATMIVLGLFGALVTLVFLGSILGKARRK